MKKNRVHCIDAIKGLNNIKSGSVDAIITDPPYGISKGKIKGDENLTTFIGVLPECYRVLKDESFFCTFTSIAKINKVLEAVENAGFTYRWACVMCSTNGMVRGSLGFNNFILLLVFMKGQAKIKRAIQDTYITYNSSKKMAARIHCYQKEHAFIERVLPAVTKEEELIVDPFAGSGSTGVACLHLNRRFIGFEIEKEYCMKANKWLKESQQQKLL